MSNLTLDPRKTALVLIDLQNGVVGRPGAPYSSAQVMEQSRRLAEAFRAKDAQVVYVHVNMADFLQLPVDEPMRGGGGPPPPSASDFAPGSGRQQDDLVITKRHWGAFAGTSLDSELRSRGVDTVVLGGISTNFGVESTARQGTGLGFGFVIVEDACTSFDADAHRFAFDVIFPRLARVRSTSEVLAALG